MKTFISILCGILIVLLGIGIYVKTNQRRGLPAIHYQFHHILISFHNYASRHDDALPQDIRSERGKPLLSWRVAILPFIEQEELYNQFKLDESWDSPHNRKLLPKMPRCYFLDFVKSAPGFTHIQGFAGPGTLFDPTRKLPLTFNKVANADGTSCTIYLAIAATPVPWTKPQDIEYSPNKPLPSLIGPSENGFWVGLADGSTRWVSHEVSETALRRAITWNDGKPLGDDW